MNVKILWILVVCLIPTICVCRKAKQIENSASNLCLQCFKNSHLVNFTRGTIYTVVFVCVTIISHPKSNPKEEYHIWCENPQIHKTQCAANHQSGFISNYSKCNLDHEHDSVSKHITLTTRCRVSCGCFRSSKFSEYLFAIFQKWNTNIHAYTVLCPSTTRFEQKLCADGQLWGWVSVNNIRVR